MTHNPNDLQEWMLNKYGPLMGGGDLYSAMGFKTYAAFHRARMKGDVEVNVFPLQGRRGLFALTTDVVAWVRKHAAPDEKKEVAMNS